MKSKISDKSRRKFVKQVSLATAGFYIVPRHVLGGTGFTSPSDTVNIAGIGVGGRGNGVLRSLEGTGNVNVVALCDVDAERANSAFERHVTKPKFTDFREMLDKHKNDIDAVTVATPDHTHAVAAMSAMQLNKHVYVEKPLTHNVYEARMLTEAAKKYNVASQMGNQGASSNGTWQIVKWLEEGKIGTVKTIHCWTNRPIWPQGIPLPQGSDPVPETLAWDLWLGPAPWREYNTAFLPFKWRGWWDYGTGALGDMACHIVDPAFRALKLGYPTAVEASATSAYIDDFNEANYPHSCPMASKVVFDFPANGEREALKLIWYDGGLLPDRPDIMDPNEPLGGWDGGVLIEGTEGVLKHGVYGANPKLMPEALMEEENPDEFKSPITEGHYQNFINACKGEGKAVSDFEIAGPLTETILMGNLAVRSHGTKILGEGKKPGDWAAWEYPGRMKLLWDGPNMKITNYEAANAFVKREYREGWSL